MSRPADGPLAVGVDLGGTKIDARLLDTTGRVFAHTRAATPRTGGDAVIDRIVDAVATVTEGLDRDALAGIGVGAAGVIDPADGNVVDATDAIPGWKGVRLATALSQRTGLPVRVVNDVHAHALGEFAAAGLPGDASLLLIAVGTGIGGAFVRDGGVMAGAHGAAGHFGHIASPHAAGLACSCGGLGHAEASGSGPAILEAFQRLGGMAPDTYAVARSAEQGDERALTAVELSARTVGSLVGSLVNSFDPTHVVVGGGVPHIAGWWQAFEAAARHEALPLLRSFTVSPSSSEAAACIGAASLILGSVRTSSTNRSTPHD
ncbi:ROK family protein [Leifsonia sp. NPDC058194]|uniref:ROK family protein n=1 Tax=Leifsonia sp. NPDC058194 TaxID=3346374 RepID=UPI0036DCEEDA